MLSGVVAGFLRRLVRIPAVLVVVHCWHVGFVAVATTVVVRVIVARNRVVEYGGWRKDCLVCVFVLFVGCCPVRLGV